MGIRREDVEAVRDKSRIEDVVSEHVALRPAGVGSLKGLCPFHDEKSPSFHVRPAVGRYHCFGCNEGGDVIDFVQKADHLAFTDAVERLAARVGIEVRYEDDAGGRTTARRDGVGQRQRLIEANRVAAAYFAEQLGTPDAAVARQFVTDRGFDRAAAELFGVGFAPRGGEVLLRHLRGRGFTEDELVASGLAGRGQRGLYDRFRGRLIWPIRDVTSDVVGFGARRIFDDDSIEAKYLNTPETAIYKKSQVLYGVDLAKRDITRSRELVVVEGYTDVMACHLAGITTAVATCGTAFGTDHIRIARRLIGDDARSGGRVIFTFDGDAAGQKAAMRAFEEDQRFVAQTFIAVARDGMDPCDLRIKHGDESVRQLIASRQPLFEFAIKSTIALADLNTAEGRVQALRLSVPVVAQIRDSSLRPEYARQLAGWLGMEVEAVRRAVDQEVRHPKPPAGQHGSQHGGSSGSASSPSNNRPADERNRPGADRGAQPERPAPHADLNDPVLRTEQQALACMLQVPRLVPAVEADALTSRSFRSPAYQSVYEAIRAAGGMAVAVGLSSAGWVESVYEMAPADVASLVTTLAVVPLPADNEDEIGRHAVSMVLTLAQGELVKRLGDLRSRVQRLSGTEPDFQQVMIDLSQAEAQRRQLADRIHGAS